MRKTDAELYAEAVAERDALWQRFVDEHYEGETRVVRHGAHQIRQTFRRGEWWNELVR